MNYGKQLYKIGIAIGSVIAIPYAAICALVGIIIAIATLPCALVALLCGNTDKASHILRKGIAMAYTCGSLAHRVAQNAHSQFANSDQIYEKEIHKEYYMKFECINNINANHISIGTIYYGNVVLNESGATHVIIYNDNEIWMEYHTYHFKHVIDPPS